MLGYATIVATSALGYFGAPWWSLLCGIVALTMLSLRELQPLRPRFSAIGAPYLLENAAYARVGHSVLAAIAAFAWGALVRVVLGG